MKRFLLLSVAFATIFHLAAQDSATFRKWGNESMAVIDANLMKNKFTYLYDEDLGGNAAFAWPMGIVLKALIYADRIKDAEGLCSELYANYYCYNKNFYAFNAVCNNNGDRYYDDNAWLAKDFLDLYEKSGNQKYKFWAQTIHNFCMSGECPSGGIRFHENDSDPTSDRYDKYATCATAPTACVCLRLYQITKLDKYLTNGKRLYDFMKTAGWGIGPGYRGYENAVVMQAAILLYQITNEDKYLKDAQGLGHAMEARYISWQSKRLNEVGCWGGHDMTDAYVKMYEVDKDQNWLNIVAGYLTYLHDNCKDAQGYYPESWNDTERNGKRYQLLDQASVAAAFMKMSTTRGGEKKKPEPVAIFQDQTYNNNGATGGAWSLGLTPGNYTQEDLLFLGLMNNKYQFVKDISSMIVNSGYRVILYSLNNFAGYTKTYDANIGTMSSWNDRTVSLKVIDLNNALEVADKDQFVTYSDRDILYMEKLQGSSHLELFTLGGLKVYETVTEAPSFAIPTARLEPGIYVLRVNNIPIKVQIR